MKTFLKDLGVDTLFIEPGSPWENGYVESFKSRMRNELVDGELFLHIDETKYVVERWRTDYNHYQPHSSLSYMTPAVFAELVANPAVSGRICRCLMEYRTVESSHILLTDKSGQINN